MFAPGLLAASAGLSEGSLVAVRAALELPGRWVTASVSVYLFLSLLERSGRRLACSRLVRGLRI